MPLVIHALPLGVVLHTSGGRVRNGEIPEEARVELEASGYVVTGWRHGIPERRPSEDEEREFAAEAKRRTREVSSLLDRLMVPLRKKTHIQS